MKTSSGIIKDPINFKSISQLYGQKLTYLQNRSPTKIKVLAVLSFEALQIPNYLLGNLEDNISEVTENDDILDDLPETEVDQALSYFIPILLV